MSLNPNKDDGLIHGYLQRLPLPEAQRQVLERQIEQAVAQGEDPWTALHEAIGQHGTVTEPSMASEGQRLMLGVGAGPLAAGVMHSDASGAEIAAMPPHARSSLVPVPWVTNPLVRMWRRLRDGRPPAPPITRATLHDDDGAPWRRAGSRRRMVLLAGVTVQTAVATWYMKGVLPYQG